MNIWTDIYPTPCIKVESILAQRQSMIIKNILKKLDAKIYMDIKNLDLANRQNIF